jgi:hypothetical protein
MLARKGSRSIQKGTRAAFGKAQGVHGYRRRENFSREKLFEMERKQRRETSGSCDIKKRNS